ncbi:hypothetical protein ACFQ3S_02440 [Mucilaginibacter terrae]|uniref:hypothetical protein n=1 Tax=Mucilaginibacter terrae TaxID=1955052 RepID=UPI00363CB749
MKFFNHKLLLTAIIMVYTFTAGAQDMGQVFMDNAAATQQAYMTSHINGLILKNVIKGGKSTAESHLTYNPSLKIRNQVIDRMAAKMKSNSSNIVALKQYDFNKIFTGITAPYHLQYNDAADIVTAYQVLNWMIANNAADPKPTAVNAVKSSTILALQQNREIAQDAGNRAMLGEEMKILFVMLHAGWQEAKKTGKVANYSTTLAQQYQQQFKQDLRSLRLDDKGLHL